MTVPAYGGDTSAMSGLVDRKVPAMTTKIAKMKSCPFLKKLLQKSKIFNKNIKAKISPKC